MQYLNYLDSAHTPHMQSCQLPKNFFQNQKSHPFDHTLFLVTMLFVLNLGRGAWEIIEVTEVEARRAKRKYILLCIMFVGLLSLFYNGLMSMY